MYNDKLIICKEYIITPIENSITSVYFYQNNEPVSNFTTDDMISEFEAFSKNRMDALYLNESMKT